jgi:hypothetical protein
MLTPVNRFPTARPIQESMLTLWVMPLWPTSCPMKADWCQKAPMNRAPHSRIHTGCGKRRLGDGSGGRGQARGQGQNDTHHYARGRRCTIPPSQCGCGTYEPRTEGSATAPCTADTTGRQHAGSSTSSGSQTGLHGQGTHTRSQLDTMRIRGQCVDVVTRGQHSSTTAARNGALFRRKVFLSSLNSCTKGVGAASAGDS